MLDRAFRLLPALAASLVLGIAALAVPVIPGTAQLAYAQVSTEFQEALEPYGHWVRSARWGEVWVPEDLPPDWRPYEYGHWVYTDEWGWYWISDPEEEDWGWVVFHYGRWAFERALGWFWIPDDEWAPAWVDWRYGADYIGWAPLPPDEIIYEYDDNPTYWFFVSPRYLSAPTWRRYWVPPARRPFVFRRTQVVNRTLGYGRGRAAVNAGVSPAYVARASRAAVATYRVTPRVLSGTQGVAGAIHVTPQQVQSQRGTVQRGRRPSPTRANAVTVQKSAAVALPVGPAPAAPQPLAKGQRGTLGTHPPRAAQGAPPPQPQTQQPPPPAQLAPPPQQRAAPPAQPSRSGPPPSPPGAQPPRVTQPPSAQPPRAAPAQPPAPQARPERPIAPRPAAPQEHRAPSPPQERRAPPPPQERRAPPPPAPAVPARPAPPAPARPAPPHPPPAAPRPQPPPQAAHPAPPPAAHPPPPAKPAPKREEKKPEPPK